MGSASIVRILRFAEWMRSRHTAATPQEIMDRFGVARATAYRWIIDWHAATGTRSPYDDIGLRISDGHERARERRAA